MKLQGEIIVLEEPEKIRFEAVEIDTAKIKPDELVAKTIFSAISPGTETAAYSGKQSLRPAIDQPAYPRLLGYCNVARIINIGKKIRSVKPGDLILTGQSHRSIFTIPETDILSKIPRGADPKIATLAYLYNLGLNSLEAAELKSKPEVAIIGLGILGLASIELAKNLKLKVHAFSNSQHKLEIAKNLGAKTYLKKQSEDLKNIADLVVVTSNSWQDWRLALQLAKKNAVISVLGFPGRGENNPDFNPLEPQYFYDKRLTIIPAGLPYGLKDEKEISKKNKANCKKILSLIAGKKLKPNKLISGIYDHRDVEKAYEKLLSRDEASITYLLKWPE